MSKFIRVFDENGKYAIKPEDCPIYINKNKYGMIVYDHDRNITLCPRVDGDDQFKMLDLKTGKIENYYHDGPLFIHHKKYGIIHQPIYKFANECFAHFDDEDNNEPRGYVISSDLLTLKKKILKDHLKECFDWVEENNGKLTVCEHLRETEKNLGECWQSCFGKYYGVPDIDNLTNMTKKELVYLILTLSENCVYGICIIDKFSEYGIFKHKYLKSCGCHEFTDCGCVEIKIKMINLL